MSRHDAHWLDELAVRVTRGGFLRTAILAAGGITLPLTRPRLATAAGNDPTACRKGCYFTAHKNARRELNACATNVRTQTATGAVTFLWMSPLLALGLAATGPSVGECEDRTLLAVKAAMYDCLQPDCPGFDPAQPGGPCDGCAPYGHCCPDQAVTSGYSCCSGCCNPSGDGCSSGVSQCGG